DLSAAVQNALQTLLQQIRAEIHEEFRTSFGPSDAGGNPPPVTIHTWLERFIKQKPHSFEKAIAPVDAENWISHTEKIFDTSTETSTEFMQHFLRLVGFLRAAASTEEEQANNFQWGLRRSTLNHLMCMSFTDVAQVANAARNYEILHERDDEDTERPNKRQRSVTTGIPVMGVTRETGVRSPTDLPILVPSSPGYGQAGHLQKDFKKNTTASTSGQANKKPGVSGRVFTITEGHAANTLGGYKDPLILEELFQLMQLDVMMMKNHDVVIVMPEERVCDGSQLEFVSLHPE
nr:zinc finger, CCHC-type, retrotransposon Gag domain protein [Tanacetum cinerariifolium]